LVECKGECDDILASYGITTARYVQIESQNWNALWESNFEPVEVDDRVLIRAPFHTPNPNVEFEIVIMPKMSIGTGHHATTKMMVEMVLDTNVAGKSGLDMGSGTGVLAIIAAKCGAESVDAVDIDDWAYENCIENCRENGVSEQITAILGDVRKIHGKRYDTILANINRNILLADMPHYTEALNPGGELIMSGILEGDIQAIRMRAEELGLTFVGCDLKDGWAAVVTRKE
jgi:ribosomal protein L11 methyltransferase